MRVSYLLWEIISHCKLAASESCFSRNWQYLTLFDPQVAPKKVKNCLLGQKNHRERLTGNIQIGTISALIYALNVYWLKKFMCRINFSLKSSWRWLSECFIYWMHSYNSRICDLKLESWSILTIVIVSLRRCCLTHYYHF